MKPPLRIAIAGLGTVGSGAVSLLRRNAPLIAERCGRSIEIVAVAARDRARARPVPLEGLAWYEDPVAMAAAPGIDVVLELIGGSDGVAHEIVKTALAAGRSVVTANKALLAHHGTSLARLAEERGLALGFEAAVAGGIPILKALREGLAANNILAVCGILNGTCNYILTQMRETGRDFAAVLAEAQALGYAETDPSFDIDGIDAAHKLALLAAVAFGSAVDFAGVHVEGIRRIAAMDIAYAAELGYRIKLLGLARLTEHGLEQRVHPCLVPLAAPLAHVEGVFNAVMVESDFAGRITLEGRGAPGFGMPAAKLAKRARAPMAQHAGAYYVRLMVVDRPGVIADVAAAFRDEAVSMEQFLQHGRAPGEVVPVVLTTHATAEAAMTRALARIGALDAVIEPPHMIRIEAI